MIAVICSDQQRPAVRELFELFKTPWELYRPGVAYDVVVASGDGRPAVDARLLVVYGSEVTSPGAPDGSVRRVRQRGGVIAYRQAVLPIYGELSTFDGGAAWQVETESAPHTGRRDRKVVRVGYDLFDEVRFLLTEGQPPGHAHVPTLDLHIAVLRDLILDAGISLVEVPPTPAGHRFMACLTHDIDFAGIRRHRFDRSMWGFLYRATVGTVRNFLRRRISVTRLLANWRAAASLPLVHLGWARDFWEPFAWYLRVERDLPATYFVIPFKHRAGEHVAHPRAALRAAAYDVTELSESIADLMKQGCEIGVHGIDAWHSASRGREEAARTAAVTGQRPAGIRMHWLLRGDDTYRLLEHAGYGYDSSAGYNETVGYRNGTSQTFRPLDTDTLLELPMHIQDGALFDPTRLDLSEAEAWERCRPMIEHAARRGGVLTLLWHDRSHAPERFWGDFYLRLLGSLRSVDGCFFGTAAEIVAWFRTRRGVRFDRQATGPGLAGMYLGSETGSCSPPLTVRVHRPRHRRHETAPLSDTPVPFVDIPWDGTHALSLDDVLAAVGHAGRGESARGAAGDTRGVPPRLSPVGA